MPRQRRAKTEMIHTRIEPKLKKSADRILSDIGISTAEAIRLFLKQVELHQGLPFPISIPNKETVAAMMEANKRSKLKQYRSFRELRDRQAAVPTQRSRRPLL